MGLDVDNYDIDELVEEHSQELTTGELIELHWVSQQEVVEESLSEEEGITSKQQSSGAIRERLKAWEAVALYIEKHYPKKTMNFRATNIFKGSYHGVNGPITASNPEYDSELKAAVFDYARSKGIRVGDINGPQAT
ncbi:hypothetical protein AVEN_249117-1, partial [Araneus ventricosus]